MPEAPECGVLAPHVRRVIGVVFTDPSVLLELDRVVLGILGPTAELVPAVLVGDVDRHVEPVVVEVLLARDRRAPRGDAAGAVAQCAVRSGADARRPRQRAGELEVRPVPVDPAVVWGG